MQFDISPAAFVVSTLIFGSIAYILMHGNLV